MDDGDEFRFLHEHFLGSTAWPPSYKKGEAMTDRLFALALRAYDRLPPRLLLWAVVASVPFTVLGSVAR